MPRPPRHDGGRRSGWTRSWRGPTPPTTPPTTRSPTSPRRPRSARCSARLLGLWAAVTWDLLGRPDPVLLVEAGPGRGTLMADALRAVTQVDARLPRRPVAASDRDLPAAAGGRRRPPAGGDLARLAGHRAARAAAAAGQRVPRRAADPPVRSPGRGLDGAVRRRRAMDRANCRPPTAAVRDGVGEGETVVELNANRPALAHRRWRAASPPAPGAALFLDYGPGAQRRPATTSGDRRPGSRPIRCRRREPPT